MMSFVQQQHDDDEDDDDEEEEDDAPMTALAVSFSLYEVMVLDPRRYAMDDSATAAEKVYASCTSLFHDFLIN